MSSARTILLVEDDLEIADVLREQLQREGYFCEYASSGERALSSVTNCTPDLILLDRMLPGINGDEVIKRVKNDPRTRDVPIIMLTGKADETDQLVGLALGADDYIAKPFSLRLLLARVAAHLRRREVAETRDDILAARSIALDRTQPQVFVDRVPVRLSAAEYKLLAMLIAARGHILCRHQLISLVYGDQPPADSPSIDGQVEALRRKMGPGAGYIQAIADQGYAFCAPEANALYA